MYVCECCLAAIESHEGSQRHKRIDYFDRADLPEGIIHEDEDGNETFYCAWCDEECDVNEMIEI